MRTHLSATGVSGCQAQLRSTGFPWCFSVEEAETTAGPSGVWQELEPRRSHSCCHWRCPRQPDRKRKLAAFSCPLMSPWCLCWVTLESETFILYSSEQGKGSCGSPKSTSTGSFLSATREKLGCSSVVDVCPPQRGNPNGLAEELTFVQKKKRGSYGGERIKVIYV